MSTLALGMPGGFEWIIIGAIGLLLFGRRLPEVGRGLGRSIVEFRKGIKGIEDEIEKESSRDSKPNIFPDVANRGNGAGRTQAGVEGTAPFQAGDKAPSTPATQSGDHS